MDKELFESLKEGIRQMKAIERGEMLPGRIWVSPDVKAKDIRERLGLTQEDFARLMGVNVWTLRNWEQEKRKPAGPALILLRTIERHPEAVQDAVESMKPRLIDKPVQKDVERLGISAPKKRGRPKKAETRMEAHP